MRFLLRSSPSETILPYNTPIKFSKNLLEENEIAYDESTIRYGGLLTKVLTVNDSDFGYTINILNQAGAQ